MATPRPQVLFNALATKFPEAQEKEILKVIGNLVYYKLINPAIIAPDRWQKMRLLFRWGDECSFV
jgi:hypothetical protein